MQKFNFNYRNFNELIFVKVIIVKTKKKEAYRTLQLIS